MNNKCKFCKEKLPIMALSWANQRSIELGYCGFLCLKAAVGDRAYDLIGQRPEPKAGG